MEDLLKKELQQINPPIEELLKNYLLNGFENRKKQPIVKVDGFRFMKIIIDEDLSAIKDLIIVKKVNSQVDVWVKIGDDARSNNTLNIFTHKDIRLKYDFEAKKYIIENPQDVIIIDNTIY